MTYLQCYPFRVNSKGNPTAFRIPLTVILGNDDWKFDEFIFGSDNVRVNKREDKFYIDVNVWDMDGVVGKCVVQLPTGQYYIIYSEDIIHFVNEEDAKEVPTILKFPTVTSPPLSF